MLIANNSHDIILKIEKVGLSMVILVKILVINPLV